MALVPNLSLGWPEGGRLPCAGFITSVSSSASKVIKLNEQQSLSSGSQMTPAQLHGCREAQGGGTFLFPLLISPISEWAGLGKGGGKSGSQNACLEAEQRG